MDSIYIAYRGNFAERRKHLSLHTRLLLVDFLFLTTKFYVGLHVRVYMHASLIYRPLSSATYINVVSV